MSQVRKQLETFRKFPSKTALWRGNRSHKESILHFDCGAALCDDVKHIPCILRGYEEKMADFMQKQRARKRWKILASVIKKETIETEHNKMSVRRFSGFNLFAKKSIQSEAGCEWVDYHLQNQVLENVSLCEQKPLFIKQRSRQVVVEDLTGFDNTGNVCLWPSEEVLAYYLLKHKDQLHGKAVCELGAGMTGLAGFCLAAFANPSKVLLTDGNEDCVENMKAIIDRNKSCFDLTVVSPQVLVWDTEANLSDLRSQFDFIISGDCLFFTNCHSGLLHVIGTLLREDGSAVLMAPNRKDTLDLFCNRANAQFNVDKIENYDPLVWTRHQVAKSEDPLYDEDIHYPVLLLLRKKTGKNMSQVL